MFAFRALYTSWLAITLDIIVILKNEDFVQHGTPFFPETCESRAIHSLLRFEQRLMTLVSSLDVSLPDLVPSVAFYISCINIYGKHHQKVPRTVLKASNRQEDGIGYELGPADSLHLLILWDVRTPPLIDSSLQTLPFWIACYVQDFTTELTINSTPIAAHPLGST